MPVVIEREQIEKLSKSLFRQEREAAAIAARCREEGNEEAALFNTGMVAGYSVARLSLMTLLEHPPHISAVPPPPRPKRRLRPEYEEGHTSEVVR